MLGRTILVVMAFLIWGCAPQEREITAGILYEHPDEPTLDPALITFLADLNRDHDRNGSDYFVSSKMVELKQAVTDKRYAAAKAIIADIRTERLRLHAVPETTLPISFTPNPGLRVDAVTLPRHASTSSNEGVNLPVVPSSDKATELILPDENQTPSLKPKREVYLVPIRGTTNGFFEVRKP